MKLSLNTKIKELYSIMSVSSFNKKLAGINSFTINITNASLVLVCYRNYRYPGCTTRTSVPSQPTALQKPSYKKEPYLQNKKHHHHHHHHHHTQHHTTQHHRPTQPNTTAQPNPTQREKGFQLAN